jgi:hypothetical protein
MFAGLKLDATPATPTPVKAPEQSQDRAFVRAVERASRSSEAVLQARASGAPSSSIRKSRSSARCRRSTRSGRERRTIWSAMQRDPALLHDAAAGRSGPMIEAMRQEARVRADPICAPIGSWNAGNSSPRTATGFIAPAT